MALYRQVQQLFDPIYNKQRRHITWGKLTVAIEKYQLLLENQQRQFYASLEELLIKKMEYLKSFIQYKQNLQTIKQKQKQDVQQMFPKLVKKFFQKGYDQITIILKQLKRNPSILSRLLSFLPKAYESICQDMSLNLVGLYNSSHLLQQQSCPQSQFSHFLNVFIKDWQYSQSFDPGQIHSQIVLSIFKLPQSKKYMQTLIKSFNKLIEGLGEQNSIDINKAHIQKQILDRNQKSKEQKSAKKQKKSFWGNLFKKKTNDKDLGMSLQPIRNDNKQQIQQILERRIKLITEYAQKTINIILQSQMPEICKLLMRKIGQKLNFQKQILYKDIGNILLKKWIISQLKISQHKHQKQFQILGLLDIVEAMFMFNYQKLMINTKQQIKLKQKYDQQVKDFYSKIINKKTISQINNISSISKYQQNLKLISFRDIVVIVNLIKAAQKKKEVQEPLLSLNLDFSKDAIYEPQNKISFKNQKLLNKNIYFCFQLESEEEYANKCYLGIKNPLSQLPSIYETLIQSNIPINQAKTISTSFEFLKGVDPKLIVKAFEGLQTSYPSLPIQNIFQLETVLSLNKIMAQLLKNKSLFLRSKNILLKQITTQSELIQNFIKRSKAKFIYQKYVKNMIDNMEILIYITIQNKKIRVQKNIQPTQQHKKFRLNAVLMTKKVENKAGQYVMNEILQNSLKDFKRIPKLLQDLSKIEITRKAFVRGQNAEDFNDSFKKICQILHERLQQQRKQQKQLITFQQQKKMFDEAISKKLVDLVFKNQKEQDSADTKFLARLSKLDPEQFKKKQLSEIPIQDFAFEQAIQKFRNIDNKQSPQAKLAQFDVLVRQIFKVISLSIPKQKITADIITPVIQYVVLKAKAKHSFRSSREIRCLCMSESNYLITLWRSALSYLKDLTKKDDSISQSTVSITSASNKDKDN